MDKYGNRQKDGDTLKKRKKVAIKIAKKKLLLKVLNSKLESRTKSFFCGLATKGGGGVRAWPLRKKITFLML